MVGCGGGTEEGGGGPWRRRGIKADGRWPQSESGMAGTPKAALALSLFVAAQVIIF